MVSSNEKTAGLGPMAERVKTDVRLPYALTTQIEAMTQLLGVPKNAFIAMAVAQYLVELARLDPKTKKRSTLLDEMEKLFQNVLDEARKSA